MEQIPTIFVVFGVTGDLSQKKLIPALYSLFTHNVLPKKFKIVGFSRREWTHADLHAFITEVLVKKGITDNLEAFLKHIEYAQGVFDDAQAYSNLKKQLDDIDMNWGQCSNKLLYLSVSPNFYSTIFDALAAAKLNLPCSDSTGWTRILVEKPFGKDTKTAAVLEKQLAKIFKEEQIFRIDHYLAKETVQNILAFRFTNSIFEHIWNNQSIEKIDILLYEKDGIGTRGEFYDAVGALRDVGQNHILQMLALIAMEKPASLDAQAVRTERAKVLYRLSLAATPELVRGQYKGYVEEKGITANSQTETYFKATVAVNTRRWKNVPFTLESGKGMKESRIEIVVHFKKTLGAESNTIHFRIQPNEGIDLNFWVKKPGFEQVLEESKLSFSYPSAEVLPDAYERVLFDCVRGDQTLFASTDEVTYSWKFITPTLERLQQEPLMPYTKHTNGPLLSK